MRHMERLSTDQGKPLAIILPGVLDHAEYEAYQRLGSTASECGYHTTILDMFQLHGVWRTADNEYHCDWHVSDYLRLIHKAIQAHRSDKPATLVGFSYGAQIALLYARVAPEFDLGQVDKVVSIMPPNHWHWESYEAPTDLTWMARQYRQHGTVELDTTHRELRSASRADLSTSTPEDHEIINITRRSIVSHLTPFNHLLPGTTLPIGLTGLVESRLLSGMAQSTLTVAGRYDVLTPNFLDRVRQIHEALPRNSSHDYAELPVGHDYRDDRSQVATVNATVRDWLMAA